MAVEVVSPKPVIKVLDLPHHVLYRSETVSFSTLVRKDGLNGNEKEVREDVALSCLVRAGRNMVWLRNNPGRSNSKKFHQLREMFVAYKANKNGTLASGFDFEESKGEQKDQDRFTDKMVEAGQDLEVLRQRTVSKLDAQSTGKTS